MTAYSFVRKTLLAFVAALAMSIPFTMIISRVWGADRYGNAVFAEYGEHRALTRGGSLECVIIDSESRCTESTTPASVLSVDGAKFIVGITSERPAFVTVGGHRYCVATTKLEDRWAFAVQVPKSTVASKIVVGQKPC